MVTKLATPSVSIRILTFLMNILLNNPITKKWAFEKLKSWENAFNYNWRLYEVAFYMQGALEKMTKGTICNYCEWNIVPGERHGLCEMITKVTNMSDFALLAVWNSLIDDPHMFYDKEAKITMEEWANTIHSAVSFRNLLWKTDNTFDWPYEPMDDGYLVTCQHCGETYWSEDGHPSGTLCPMYEDLPEEHIL